MDPVKNSEHAAKRKRPQSRAARWAEACDHAMGAIGRVTAQIDELEQALADLRELQEEYEGWKDNLPENLQASPLGEKLEAVCDLQIEDAVEPLRSAADDVESLISEAESTDLPQGFGRD